MPCRILYLYFLYTAQLFSENPYLVVIVLERCKSVSLLKPFHKTVQHKVSADFFSVFVGTKRYQYGIGPVLGTAICRSIRWHLACRHRRISCCRFSPPGERRKKSDSRISVFAGYGHSNFAKYFFIGYFDTMPIIIWEI